MASVLSRTALRLLTSRSMLRTTRPGTRIGAQFHQFSGLKLRVPVAFGVAAGALATGATTYVRYNPDFRFRVVQSLPFFGVLFSPDEEKEAGDAQNKAENSDGDEAAASAVEKILELKPIERYEAANNLLTELVSNLGLSILATVSLNSLAATTLRTFNDELARFAPDLTNTTTHDSVSDSVVLKLLEEDRDLQLLMIKTLDTTADAKAKMHTLEKVLGDLCCSKIPLSEEVIEKAEKSLKEAQVELNQAEDFLAQSVKGAGPPDALLSRVIRMTSDFEEDFGFTLAGLCSKEARELYNRALANYIHQQRNSSRKHLDELHTRSEELKAVVGKEGERKRLDALIKNKEEELRRSLNENYHFQLNQLKKKLKHQVQVEKNERIEKTSHDHQAILRARKFAFEREMKEQIERIRTEIDQFTEEIAQQLDNLAPDTKKHELNIQKLSDALTLANACFQLQSALTTDPFPQLGWQHQVQPVRHLLQRIGENSEAHRSFVRTVLGGVPATVLNRGVFTENALRQRFRELEPMARRVSLLKKRDGNSMMMYAFSFLRSMMLLRPASCISMREMANRPVNFAEMSNEELLDRAKYFMELGDLRQAAGYVNMLQGVAQFITSGWTEEVLLHLEVTQAARALSSFATLLVHHYHMDMNKHREQLQH